MNKISKKIVALATMAAFVLTLVPAAAFAAPGDEVTKAGQPVVTDSYYRVVGGNTTADKDEVVETVFDLYDNQHQATDPANVIDNVKVWATDETGAVSDNATFYTDANGSVKAATTSVAGVYNVTNIGNTSKLYVAFSAPGEYTIHAGYGNLKDGAINGDVTKLANMKVDVDASVVTIAEPEVNTTIVEFYSTDAADGSNKVTFNKDNTVGKIDLIGKNGTFVANGVDKYTLSGTAYQEEWVRSPYETITLTSGKPDVMTILGDEDPDTEGVQITTDNAGRFSVEFTMNDNRNVPITVTVDGQKYILQILKEETTAYDIDTTKDGGYVLAGTDEENFTSAASADFSDAVQFTITDIKGNVIEELSSEEPATNAALPNHTQYLDVTGRADKSTLDANDLQLKDLGNGLYTLEYVEATQSEWAKDLVPGEYTVSVALLSGDYAVASFKVAEFGKIVDLDVTLTSYDQSAWNNLSWEARSVVLDDEVTLGQVVRATAKYVDENGLKIDANTDVVYGFNGSAVEDRNYPNRYFTTYTDEPSNESLIGSTIEVKAFDEKNRLDITKELTVVDSYNTFTLEFDPTEGPVAEDNDVDVTVVKENGDKAQVDGTLMAYVADQSNEDAVVTLDVNRTVENGEGTLTVYASEPTTVDIVVAVKDATNQGLYAATLEYTVGNVDITAHHNVVMTIGSSEYVVDKQLFTMDAAPYVDSNWRTMVPIRALAEAFDATVTYDNDARTVTIEYNDQTIVMTIDDATYTVNGVEAEMDTEAVINSADDRTYVPVRFAAEAMGFTVTALYDENSSTASVVFQS